MKGVLPKLKVFGYSAMLDALSAEKQSIGVKIMAWFFFSFWQCQDPVQWQFVQIRKLSSLSFLFLYILIKSELIFVISLVISREN